jgi:hypothetical protein
LFPFLAMFLMKISSNAKSSPRHIWLWLQKSYISILNFFFPFYVLLLLNLGLDGNNYLSWNYDKSATFRQFFE